MNFSHPTPIQALAIPPGLEGKDLLGIAQTGTGKTAAFTLPILVHLLRSPEESALILAPTRELAQQISQFWDKLTRYSPQLRSTLILGGASMGHQVRQLKSNPRLLIATPGRLVDHIEQRTVDLSRCMTLVLDEADRMLDMGFAPQLNRIRAALAHGGSRRTMLFSATWGREMDALSKKYLRDPVRVSVGEISQAARTVEQSAILTVAQKKNETLLDEINARADGSILVFTRTQHRTDRIARYLSSYGLQVNRIHGGRTQGQRNAALAEFRAGRVRIMVATDIAARGIDVAQIGHVINFDLPQVAEDYIHRIGRTGRAGNEGSAVSFVTAEDRSEWNAILKLLEKTGSAKPTVRDLRDAPPAENRPERRPAPTPPSRPPHGAKHRRSRPRRPLQPHERSHAAAEETGRGRIVQGGGLRTRRSMR